MFSPAIALSLPSLLPLPVSTPTSELDAARVPASASWLVHVDMEAFRRTSLWELLQKEMQSGEVDVDFDELKMFEERFGFRPFEDVHSVTVAGRGEIGDDGLVLVETSDALDAAMARLQQEPEYRSMRRGGYDLHSWEEDGRSQGAFYIHHLNSRRLVVVSESESELTEGIDVLNGRAKSLRQNPDAMVIPRPTPGAFLFVDATAALSALAELEPASAVAEMARGARVEIGESRGELFLNVDIIANTPENADNIYSVINGVRAFAAMAGAQEDVPDFALEMLNSIEMQTTGSEVSLQFRYDARELVEEIRAIEEAY